MSIAKLLPLVAPITDTTHADALLEIAFLMTAVDGRLEEAELAAFREIVARVRGRATNDVDAAEVVKRYAVSNDPKQIHARVRALAPTLPPALRETAFRLSIGLALVDNDASPLEDELASVLFEALGLDEARAEAIAAEVRAAFGQSA